MSACGGACRVNHVHVSSASRRPGRIGMLARPVDALFRVNPALQCRANVGAEAPPTGAVPWSAPVRDRGDEHLLGRGYVRLAAVACCVIHDFFPFAFRRPGHLSLRVQRKATQREDAPLPRLPGGPLRAVPSGRPPLQRVPEQRRALRGAQRRKAAAAACCSSVGPGAARPSCEAGERTRGRPLPHGRPRVGSYICTYRPAGVFGRVRSRALRHPDRKSGRGCVVLACNAARCCRGAGSCRPRAR